MKISTRSFLSVLTSGRITKRIIDLPEGATTGQALELMGIGPDEELIILVNKGITNENKILSDGDVVTVMPPVSAA